MTLIDDIKARVDIVEVIGVQVKLERSGKTWKGLCPFHGENTPSFTVWPDGKSGPYYHCFGCGAHGDVVDYVQRIEKMSFGEALRLLAAKAGLVMRPQSPEELLVQERGRVRETILGVAAEYFRECLWGDEGGAALRYALSRGFEEGTIRAAGLGYFGRDWAGLRAAMLRAGVDLSHPVAVALVGFRGDVAGWAHTWGLNPPRPWVEAGKVPAMPPNLLIYPHMVRGRVGYLSGRGLPSDSDDEKGKKRHYNLDETLVGGKQLYVNHVPLETSVVIVEGQADAITLGQWGVAAIALAGTSSDNRLLSELKPLFGQAAKGKPVSIYLALDADAAGNAALEGVAQSLLLEKGINPMHLRVVKWPAKDANDFLQGGAGVSNVQEVLQNARPWVVVLAERSRVTRDEKVVFAALSRMPLLDVERVRDDVAAALGMRRKLFDAMFRQARLDAGVDDDDAMLYYIEGDRIFCRSYDRAGNETCEPLCNFVATVTEDILRDDGQSTYHELRIEGKVREMSLPVAAVPIEEFADLTWVMKHWGVKAIIKSGARTKDRLREAIQILSASAVRSRTIFTHTGWRDLNGQRIFLSNSGAIGGEDVTVELDTDFEMYDIPLVAENLTQAIRASLSFLEIAPERVTFPLWAAVWLAPLAELVNVAFTMWVYGGTGAMKSTVSSLALNHYGSKWDDKHLPANFLDTANRLEQKTFVAKDVMLIIDDFAPQKNARDQQEYVRSAARIVRVVGNHAGRGRMAADTTARRTYYPRGLVLITGEDLPQSEGVMGRLFVVEMNRGEVNLNALSALQARRGELSHAMSGYVRWLADHWAMYRTAVPEQWRSYRQEMAGLKSHLRLPEALAGLMMGLEMGLRFARSQGAIGSEQYSDLMMRGRAALLESGRQMSERVQEEKPEVLFVRTINDLLVQGKVYLLPVDGYKSDKPLGGLVLTAELLGWYDDNWYYLMPDVAYAKATAACRDRGGTFPVSAMAVRKMLAEAGMLRMDQGQEQQRRTIVVRANGVTHRVLAVARKVVDGEQGE